MAIFSFQFGGILLNSSLPTPQHFVQRLDGIKICLSCSSLPLQYFPNRVGLLWPGKICVGMNTSHPPPLKTIRSSSNPSVSVRNGRRQGGNPSSLSVTAFHITLSIFLFQLPPQDLHPNKPFFFLRAKNCPTCPPRLSVYLLSRAAVFAIRF